MDRERALRIALWMLPGLSARALERARERHGSLAGAEAAGREALAAALGPRAGRALERAPLGLAAWAEALEAELSRREGRFVLRGEPGFPCFGALADPPELVSVRGALGGAGAGGAVAIVGSRRADPEALRLSRAFGAAAARAGLTVVSGGALGVDAAAHEGALEGGGATVAVLGSGVLRPEPARNRRLFSRMLAAGGGLVSELPPRAAAWPSHFPRRNRLVAALARAVVVTRAAAGSGSLHTVAAAERMGVPVLAVPWPGRGGAAAGGEALLASGRARPVESPGELLAALGAAAAPRRAPALEREEQQVLDALSSAPSSVAGVAEATGLPPGRVAAILAALCAGGHARAAGPGRFAPRRE